MNSDSNIDTERLVCSKCGYAHPLICPLDESFIVGNSKRKDFGRMAQATAESLKRAAAPPYPDRPCPACDAHEATITPLPTSVLPIVWPVHRPSGMVCVKWMQPEIYDALKKAGKA